VFGLLLGLDRGSNVSWSIPITIASLASSAMLFAAFIYVEMRVASEPFAPGHIIFSPSLVACYLCNFFSFGGWMASIFYLPLYFQASDDGVSATGAGLRLLPSIIAGVSGSLFGGFVMRKTGKYYWLTVIAYALLFVGLVAIALFSGIAFPQSLLVIIIGTVMCGFGNGIGVTTTLIGLCMDIFHPFSLYLVGPGRRLTNGDSVQFRA
jgi:cyanate permease